MITDENKRAYKALNQQNMKERMSKVVLHMCRRVNLPEEDEDVFQEVKDTFNNDEMAYMTCCYLGLELSAALQNPTFKMLVQLIRMLDEKTGTFDKEKQDDLMKQVEDILNKK